MKEFKFTCPSCGQKIRVESAWSGRRIECPSCQSKLLIPAAPKKTGQIPSGTLVDGKRPAATPKPSSAPVAPGPKLRPPADTRRSTPAQASSAKALAEARVSQPPVPKKHAKATPTPAGSHRAEVVKSGEAPEKKAPTTKTAPSPTKKEPAQPGTQLASTAKPGSVPPRNRVKIVKLTPALKREVIRAVRRRIGDEAHWMPRLTPERKYTYAARKQNGNWVPVGPTSPEATRFSVLGALLLELNLRNVTQTAEGRPEFLDEELLNAIRQIAGDDAAEQEASPSAVPAEGKAVPPMTHAQCMEVLELLEKRYGREAEKSQPAEGKGIEGVRLADLVRSFERKVPVTIEQLGRALANELEEIQDRLKAVERRAGKRE